ncbi:MAG: 50S ribosomal protein L13 [Prolixibacteraceae bacterium]|nr:50S ribosomal protein L13 [Prolixibacteraceae bacterium]
MDTLSYKTVSANSATVTKEWIVVDAEGQILGRLASKVAQIIRGKHKVNYTPHVDCGDNVIVINAEKVVLTGKKMADKQYVRHSGYPGGQRFQNPEQVLAKYPERLVERAVKGMLPKSKLGSDLFRNLKVVVGPEHKYEAQKPKVIDLNSIK